MRRQSRAWCLCMSLGLALMLSGMVIGGAYLHHYYAQVSRQQNMVASEILEHLGQHGRCHFEILDKGYLGYLWQTGHNANKRSNVTILFQTTFAEKQKTFFFSKYFVFRLRGSFSTSVHL